MRLNVLLLCNQIRGIDGTGGLGDVPVGLAKSLLTRGDIDIRLAMPGFADITNEKELADRFRNPPIEQLRVPFGAETREVSVFKILLPHSHPPIPCYLFRCEDVFDRRDPQSGRINKNTPDKAALFARSAVEFLRAHAEFRVDLIHCNDWHTGLTPVYLNTLYRDDLYLGRIATLYTTHNAGGDAFQGGFVDPTLLSLAGLEDQNVFTPLHTQSLCHFEKFNFTKGAIGFADLINTVSRQYRKELLTPAFAGGLEGIFLERQQDFCGIVNGIDVTEWNPQTDMNLKSHVFSANDMIDTVHKQKQAIRHLLRDWTSNPKNDPRMGEKPFGALKDSTILMGAITRIDYQKIPILLQSMDRICAMNRVQVALLGSADPNDAMGKGFEADLKAMSQKTDGKLLFFNGFDIPLSHLIFAASDMFLVPSIFEPCGLTQLVAMRYGSVPVVRSVGGLADTVIDEQDLHQAESATGFRYEGTVTNDQMITDIGEDAERLVECVDRAVALYETPRWDQLVRNGMRRDSSWAVPSMHYTRLYHAAVRRAVERTHFR